MSTYKDFMGLDLEKKQMKRCSKCKHYLNKSQFSKYKNNLAKECKRCRKKLTQNNKENTLEQKRNTTQSRSNYLYNTYGITSKEYTEMEREQDNKCAICLKEETVLDVNNKAKRLCVDHDHITGDVRGLLCSRCNLGIGYLMSDEGTDILLNAISYIEIHNLEHE